MAHILYGICLAHMPVGQYGITEIVFIGPPYLSAAAYTYRMLRSRAPLCVHDVINFFGKGDMGE